MVRAVAMGIEFVRPTLKLLFAALLVVSANAAASQTQPVQDWSAETIVVSGHRAGPIFWRASRGDSEVWILAVVGPLPKDFAWDRAGLDQLLDGAKAVYLQPRAQVGIFEAMWFYFTDNTLELPNNAKLEDVLDEPLKSRFIATRTKFERDTGRYENFRPVVAGFLLYSDYLDWAKLESGEPERTIERMARRKDVPTHPIASYEAMPVIKLLGKMPGEASRACLKDALDDIDASEAHQVPVDQAWAQGDLAQMKRQYTELTLYACLQGMPSFAALWEQSVSDTVKVADTALAQGGKTIVVASLGAILRKDGILDRLRAKGIQIDSPQ